MQARAVALDMLLAVTEEKKPSHEVFAEELAKYPDMERRERAFARRLAAGVIERMLTLDYRIGRCSKVKVEKLKPVIRAVLRMGMYQMYYMQVPPSAACNESVKLVKKRGFAGLSGYVNGVLRAAAREKEAGKEPEKTGKERDEQGTTADFFAEEMAGFNDTKALSIQYSVPEWLVSKFLSWYGREKSVQIFAAFLAPSRRLAVRVNESKTDVKNCKKRLEQEGIDAEEGSFCAGALHLSGIETVTRLPGFAEGHFQVQDESSMLPVLCAGLKAGDYVIDCCAAPGGKTLQAADVLRVKEQETKLFASAALQEKAGEGSRWQGMVSARDISDYKLAKIRENASRCGFDNVKPELVDASTLREEDIGTADVVIADLPCSGLGIIGKKPDIKYNVAPKDLEELSALQKKMLAAAAEYVKPGGVLIYSTCTLNPGENEENFCFLCETCGLLPESLNPYLPKSLQTETTGKGYLQLFPEAGRWDGFFVSRFRKKDGENGG